MKLFLDLKAHSHSVAGHCDSRNTTEIEISFLPKETQLSVTTDLQCSVNESAFSCGFEESGLHHIRDRMTAQCCFSLKNWAMLGLF